MLDDRREIGGTLVGIKVYIGIFDFLVLDGVIDIIKYDLPKSFFHFLEAELKKSSRTSSRVFPKIVVPPNHPF